MTKHKTNVVKDVIAEVIMPPELEFRNVPLRIPKHQLFNVTPSTLFEIRYFLEVCGFFSLFSNYTQSMYFIFNSLA